MSEDKFYSPYTKKSLCISRRKRGEIGYFPTPKKEVDYLLSFLNIKKDDFVLEPSFGTGDFIIPLKKLSSNVYGVEKEKSIFNDFGNCYNEDFLTWDTNLKFDFIVGNPPFFETKEYKELFEEVTFGRNNIYSFFIKKSIDLLKDNGILAFILPKTINTGLYFSRIREYIIAHTDIMNLEEINSFEDVSQNLQILILKKKENTGKFLVKKSSSIIFSSKYKELNDLINNYKTIKDLGFSVYTGSVVWNENRELLSDTHGSLLVWGGNISGFSLVKAGNRYKYILKEPSYTKGIVSNRVFSNKLNFALIDKPFLAENHVNVIINEKNIISYEELMELLKKSSLNSYCKYFTGSTQISKKELEEMPLWGVTRETGQTK